MLKTLLKTARWAAVLYAASVLLRARDERRAGRPRTPPRAVDRFDVFDLELCLDDDRSDVSTLDVLNLGVNRSHGYVPALTLIRDRS